VKISIALTNSSWPDGHVQLPGHLLDLARRVDDGASIPCGLRTILQMDPTATIDEPMLEGYTTLGYLAAATA
jgi:hypothetical protein